MISMLNDLCPPPQTPRRTSGQLTSAVASHTVACQRELSSQRLNPPPSEAIGRDSLVSPKLVNIISTRVELQLRSICAPQASSGCPKPRCSNWGRPPNAMRQHKPDLVKVTIHTYCDPILSELFQLWISRPMQATNKIGTSRKVPLRGIISESAIIFVLVHGSMKP